MIQLIIRVTSESEEVIEGVANISSDRLNERVNIIFNSPLVPLINEDIIIGLQREIILNGERLLDAALTDLHPQLIEKANKKEVKEDGENSTVCE